MLSLIAYNLQPFQNSLPKGHALFLLVVSTGVNKTFTANAPLQLVIHVDRILIRCVGVYL